MKETHISKKRAVFGLLGFTVVSTLCLTVGFYVSPLLVDKLTPFMGYLVSIWIGFLIFALMGFIAHKLSWKEVPDRRERYWHLIMDAIERISRGDFTVFVEADDDEHDKFAAAINGMAKNLGTLEAMRQDFISNVSHEIQSPLTSIGGFASLLKQDDLTADERKRYAGIIEAESKRLSSLSDNLLKLSALDDLPLSNAEYRLDKQLQNVILTLEPQWSSKNLTVEADLEKSIICGNEDLLSEVWMNLLHNAIKFTPEGGVIRVSLDQKTVKIEDTGVGIGKEDLPHIFERFYKVDKSRDRSLGGNGLGLSLVKKIVEMPGGTIEANSEPEKGTTFTIKLP